MAPKRKGLSKRALESLGFERYHDGVHYITVNPLVPEFRERRDKTSVDAYDAAEAFVLANQDLFLRLVEARNRK